MWLFSLVKLAWKKLFGKQTKSLICDEITNISQQKSSQCLNNNTDEKCAQNRKQEQNFIKGVIPLFLNSYSKNLKLKKKNGRSQDEQQIHNLLKNLKTDTRIRNKSIHKFNIKDMKRLIQQVKSFENHFSDFFNSNDLLTYIQQSKKIKQENKDNYVKAIAFMNDEQNSQSKYSKIYSAQKDLTKYKFSFSNAGQENQTIPL